MGGLNTIDLETLVNKLGTTISDLSTVEQSLESLSALGNTQWFASTPFSETEKYQNANHELLADASGITQCNVSLALSCIQAQLWLQTTNAVIIRE